jgi:hypothetical protein
MSSLRELVDQVLLNLEGDALDQGEQTFLTNDIDSGNTVISVDDASLISQGLVEIDDELIWVKSVDMQNNALNLSTLGRGYRSTSATSHSTGAVVRNNPRYSRYRVKQTINTAIRNVYPDLYAIKTYEFPYVAARLAYPLPADVDQIHNITWESVGPSRVWIPMRTYQYVPDADTTNFPSGKAINLWEGVTPGRTVRVTYIGATTPLTNDGDSFTLTGLAPTAEETIIYGACYRLVGFAEAPRMQITSVEATQRSAAVPAGAASNAGKFFYAMYQETLSQERERLLRSNRDVMHRTRRIV